MNSCRYFISVAETWIPILEQIEGRKCKYKDFDNSNLLDMMPEATEANPEVLLMSIEHHIFMSVVFDLSYSVDIRIADTGASNLTSSCKKGCIKMRAYKCNIGINGLWQSRVSMSWTFQAHLVKSIKMKV